MTQRMIELYKEAAEFAYKICRDEGREGGPSDHIWNTLSTGRFAELIVRECIEVVKWTPSQFPNDEYVKNIKEHFGVEQ